MLRETKLKQAIKDQLQDIELALNESSIVAITDSKGIIEFAVVGKTSLILDIELPPVK